MSKFIAFILRVAVAAVFIQAGATKAWNPSGFSADIREYQLVGQATSAALSLYVPWLELIAGAALLLRRLCLAGTWTLLVLVLTFSAVVISALWRGLEMNCGCFGGDDGGISLTGALIRNGAIFAGLVGILVLDRGVARPSSSATSSNAARPA